MRTRPKPRAVRQSGAVLSNASAAPRSRQGRAKIGTSVRVGEGNIALSDSRDHQRTLRPRPFDYRNIRKAIFADQIDSKRKRCLLIGLGVAAFDRAIVVALQDENVREPREVRNGLSHCLRTQIIESTKCRNQLEAA